MVTVAYGAEARRCAKELIASLKAVCDLPVAVISDFHPTLGQHYNLLCEDADPGARFAKLFQRQQGLWEQVLYLDADTLVKQCPCAPFSLLDDGWDLALSTSKNQGIDTLQNVSQPEREYTLGLLGYPDAVTLQCGVLYWQRNSRMAALWECWASEWDAFRGQDQGAFLRALQVSPVRMWLLSRDYNGHDGRIIEHRFGRAARKA